MQSSQMSMPEDVPVKWASRGKKKALRIEYRVKPEVLKRTPCFFGKKATEWRRWPSRYATEADREKAIAAHNQNNSLWEFRIA